MAHKGAAAWSGGGLYVALGRAGRRGRAAIEYVGLSKKLPGRVGPNHQALSRIGPREIWLSEVDVPGLPGRRSKRTDPHLDSAEWLTVFFLKIVENDRKRRTPPPWSAVLLNR